MEYTFPYFERAPDGGQVAREITVEAENDEEAVELATAEFHRRTG